MGLCRALVYVGAAAALGAALAGPVLLGAAILLSYVAGLTSPPRKSSIGIHIGPLSCCGPLPSAARMPPSWLGLAHRRASS